MNNFVRWLINTAAGMTAWWIASAGSQMTFWPRVGMWIVFWSLLSIYALTVKKNER